MPSPCPLPSFLLSLNSFGESCASCRSFVPTGLPAGFSLGGVAFAGGAVATGGGLATAGGLPDVAPPAGRAGSGDLPAHAATNKTTATTDARIGIMLITAVL